MELNRGLLGTLKLSPGRGEGGKRGGAGPTWPGGDPTCPRGVRGGGDGGGGEGGGVEPEAPGELAPIRLKTPLISWEEQSRPPTPEPLPFFFF